MICETGIGLLGANGTTPMVSRQGKNTINLHMSLQNRIENLNANKNKKDDNYG